MMRSEGSLRDADNLQINSHSQKIYGPARESLAAINTTTIRTLSLLNPKHDNEAFRCIQCI